MKTLLTSSGFAAFLLLSSALFEAAPLEPRGLGDALGGGNQAGAAGAGKAGAGNAGAGNAGAGNAGASNAGASNAGTGNTAKGAAGSAKASSATTAKSTGTASTAGTNSGQGSASSSTTNSGNMNSGNANSGNANAGQGGGSGLVQTMPDMGANGKASFSTPQNPNSVEINNAVNGWMADTGMVSDFLNKAQSLTNNADQFMAAATTAFNAEVNELTNKAVLDNAPFGNTQQVQDANNILDTQGNFQQVVDLLKQMAEQGPSSVNLVDTINTGRCANVLPNIDAYFQAAGTNQMAVRPTACDLTGVKGGANNTGSTSSNTGMTGTGNTGSTDTTGSSNATDSTGSGNAGSSSSNSNSNTGSNSGTGTDSTGEFLPFQL